ncbi:MAG: peptidoglycan DD-metalloendopeptidase family protein [Chloroflexi bacterium]|nr:peptidoglycan DD-metalloendopeptidase family protein [Chloroflexota bacterium]
MLGRLRALAVTLLCALALLGASGRSAAVGPRLPPPVEPEGGENAEPPHDAIDPAAEQALQDSIQRNIRQLRARGVLPAAASAQAVLYGWPVRLRPGITDYAGFYVSAFSDHNAAGSAWLDYNSGTRTYDSHRGTDIALWPYSWNKFQAGDVQIVAAADGVILDRQSQTVVDDHCLTSTDNTLGNYIVLQHADGWITIYGHMRYNSLTAKGVGQTVTLGEVIGAVGSSGNSSGPHLHFEVRTALGASTLWTDPYTGSANPAASHWLSQRPYYDSAINKLATSTALPQSESCLPTVTNIQDSFALPAHVAFQVYYRDYQGALPTLFTIADPNGGIFQSWSYSDNNTTFAPAAGRYWSFDIPANAVPGTWRFQVQYNGQAYETDFNVGASLALTVGSPNGSEQWDVQVSHPITWTDNFGNDVSIALYRNGVFSATLASAAPSSGRLDWLPGAAVATGAGYAIRVTSLTTPAVFDQSDATFALLPTTLTRRLYLPGILR